ncbi:hypothetical protein AXG93_2632s1120 [Marchantia polymorpha subsp. ruderalis]|uniref:Uncharacterized protein n=1 Tax=Marchantia polymorpha subsp. ruderalis TaxID=1480154 RepID=A0A176VV43_MARPO|nr:hypothetical protein AXG93_2632s1120 [Marchantia polymorpha subsp. ruderalis]
MKAVMIPKMPPAFVMSLSSLNSPMVSRRKVMDSEKKSVVRHTFVRRVANHIMKANPMSPRGAGFATTDLVCMGLDRMSSNRDAFSKSRSCVGYDIVDAFSVLQKRSLWLSESWSKELKPWRSVGWDETHLLWMSEREARLDVETAESGLPLASGLDSSTLSASQDCFLLFDESPSI